MKVLIIDDDADCRQIVALMLSKQGWSLYFANDGAEGLAMARAIQPDLILMDVLMPKMTGLDAVRAMRQDERLRNTPVFAITALAFDTDRHQALGVGYDRVLTKPFGRRTLLEAIGHLFPITGTVPATGELALPA